MGAMAREILIAGYYGFGNAGDEVILAGMLSDLRALDANLEFNIVSGDPQETMIRHGVQAVHWRDMRGLVDHVNRSELVIVGGGGLFQDHWGLVPDTYLTPRHGGITHYGGVALLAHMTDVPCMLYGVGVGPLFSQLAREHTREIFGLASAATVRDEGSRRLLGEIGVDISGISVTADPAFSAPVAEGRHAETVGRYSGNGEPVLAASLRYWQPDGSGPQVDPQFMDWLEGELAVALDQYVDETGGSVVFIPFQRGPIALENDLEVARRVRNRMQLKSHSGVVNDDLGPLERFQLMGDCSLVLGMRLHAVMAGIRGHRPTVGLCYDPKVDRIMEAADLSSFSVELEEAGSDLLAERLLEAYARREEMAQGLKLAARRQMVGARRNAAIAYDLLRSSKPARREPSMAHRFAVQQTLNLAEMEREREDLSARLQLAEAEAQALRDRLDAEAIKADRTLRLIQLGMGAARHPGWALREAIRRVISRLPSAIKELPLSAYRWIGRLQRAIPDFLYSYLMGLRGSEYRPEFRGQTWVYTDSEALFPDYPLRRPLSGRSLRREPVSLAVTLKDEARSLGRWLEQLEGLRRAPDEVIIVDGASQDGTQELLERFARKHPGWLRWRVAPGANIAQGRNLAIGMAQHDIVAVTDVGCDLSADWLENIVAPFEADEEIKVVAGWYRPSAATEIGRATMHALVPRLEQINPGTFIPSSRSVAFRKAVWEAVGGYPEWLSLTGEDTFLALELRRTCETWAFVPEAEVVWHAPDTLRGYLRKAASWARGDGEAGLFQDWHTRNVRLVALGAVWLLLVTVCFSIGLLLAAWATWQWWLFTALLIVSGSAILLAGATTDEEGPGLLWRLAGRAARAVGFLSGLRGRPQAWARRYAGVEGVFLLMTVVPIDDTGGGARSTQLAQELLRRGYLVYYIHAFPRYESQDLDLHITHEHLISRGRWEFPWPVFRWECSELLAEKELNMILELPLGALLPLAERVKSWGGHVTYDLIDEWDSSLGARWYRKDDEMRAIGLSDLLLATAPQLQDKLAEESGRAVTLLPNAVDLELFDRSRAYPLPDDLPPADLRMIYVGALWGEWFDWELLRAVAERYPDGQVVVIGDYRGQCPAPPANLLFLGLKPQRDVPAYLHHSDVAIIPWKINDITRATSPLKVYEFLAMGLPVVAPALRSLEGIPYVFSASGKRAFLEGIQGARDMTLDEGVLDEFLQKNSWRVRVDALLARIEGAKGKGSPA